MKENLILILGSKPNSKIPNVEVNKIYSANAAAERARFYRTKYPKTSLCSVVSKKEFKKKNIYHFILTSKPDELFIRNDLYNKIYSDTGIKNLDNMSVKEQWHFQKKFFKFGIFSLIWAEINYSRDNFLETIKYFYRTIRFGHFLGVSTGFFSILLALEKHKNFSIIVAGIGIEAGKHFYDSDNSHNYRYKIDKILFKHLKPEFRKNLISCDDSLSHYIKIENFRGNFL